MRQTLDESCGAAAIATLTRLLGNAELTEAQVLAAGGTRHAMSVAELVAVGEKLSIKLKAFAAGAAAFDKAAPPFIVLLAPMSGELGHFVVVTRIAGDHVSYADPKLGNLIVRREEFLQRWAVRKDARRPGIVVMPQAEATSMVGTDLVEVEAARPFIPPGLRAY